MKKKLYQKPTMNIVKLQHQTHLLQSSVQERNVGVQDYDVNSYYEE